MYSLSPPLRTIYSWLQAIVASSVPMENATGMKRGREDAGTRTFNVRKSALDLMNQCLQTDRHSPHLQSHFADVEKNWTDPCRLLVKNESREWAEHVGLMPFCGDSGSEWNLGVALSNGFDDPALKAFMERSNEV
ncbi:hypothetical protein HNY73_000788 [Argiope bruennichi]|uniref:Uncharacterized protein n=1 Tax=Argiope bruennichi TaxID=94029 RepID=A0A8T0FZE6_ARGBR|nr:hypothetical protein HNY73_000788 [Argiope bruennichi]